MNDRPTDKDGLYYAELLRVGFTPREIAEDYGYSEEQILRAAKPHMDEGGRK